MNIQHDHLINDIGNGHLLAEEQVLHEHTDVLHGLGTFPGSYDIDMDPGVIPDQNRRGRAPIPFRDGPKAKLDDMEIQGVITKVTEPSKWISNIVVVNT